MSHITQAQQGLAAAEAKKWDEAIAKLSPALQSSSNPAWLIARSKALVGVKRYAEALDDANLAWHSAYQRNKRPLLMEAHYRRAVAYFRMGQYANADCCCVYAMRLAKGQPAAEKRDPKEDFVDEEGKWMPTLEEAREEASNDPFNKTEKSMDVAMGGAKSGDEVNQWRMASTLRTQILFAMQKLGPEDPARKVTTSLKPEVKKLADHSSKKAEASASATQSSIKQAATTTAPKAAVPSDTPLRIQEFQSKTTMSVSIFSKGVSKENLNVDYQPQSVHLSSIVYPDGGSGPFQLELWGEIDPAGCKCTVTPNKVELNLAKKSAVMWKALYSETEKTELSREANSSKTAPDNTAAGVLTSSSTGPKPEPATSSTPATTTASEQPSSSSSDPSASTATASYPTSSKSGPRNWDKVVAENDGDRSDDEEGRDVNFFFKKLFKNATPEQQRAMMKSFTESNGTSLSTDWNDVKDRKVETVPPEGVEAKKWD